MKTDEIVIQTAGKNKIEMYKWICKDVPGEFKYIPKTKLEIDHIYQRKYSVDRTLDFASEWSWVACGTLTVSKRKDGSYYVMDGQHRLMAALRRSDINDLPCMVFESKTEDFTVSEAKDFTVANTSRHNPKSIELFHASIAAKDETSLYMLSIFERYGIKLMSDSGRGLRSVSTAKKIATQDKHGFEIVIELLSYLCADAQITEKLLNATYYLYRKLSTELTDSKLKHRILSISPKQYEVGMSEASAYFTRGGEKVWAIGMLNIINKNLRIKYKFKDESDL